MTPHDLTFLFDTDHASIPLIKTNSNQHVSVFYRKVINSSSRYKIIKPKDYYSSSPSLFVVEFIWGDVNKLFENVDKDFLNFIVKRRVPILFYFPSEGFSLKEAGWVDVLDSTFKKYNLEKNLKYFITGNLLEDSIDVFDKTYSLNYFEYELAYTTTNKNMVQPFNATLCSKPYDFLSYNANPRPGRTALASEILRLDLNKNALFSWIGNPTWSFENTKHETFKYLSAEGQKNYKQIFKNGFTPYILDVNNREKGGVVNNINTDHYKDSYFSLISETETSDQCLFITEKTYKAIYASHPFIIWSSPGTLKYLRSIGYKTFPTLFDESYDNESDPAKRLQMILSEVKKFKQLNSSEKEELIKQQNKIVKHNYKNLKRRWKTALFDDLDRIFLDIENDIKKNKDRL